MTLMSCKRAEKLMPLYAAGDLPAGRECRAVAAHVAGCASCAALAEGYGASREWARAAGEVPEFGDEFYAGLRAGVLDRVNRDTRPPARLASFFPALFAGRRLAYAASVALAACALALAFYFFDDGGRPRRNEIADVPPGGGLIVPRPRESAPPTPPGVTTQEHDGQQQQRPPTQAAPRDGGRPAQPPGERGGGGGSFKRTPTLRQNAPTPDAARGRELTAAAGEASRQGVVPDATRAETAGVSRIEIQTADPNIRIIWLTPAAGTDDEPDAPDADRVDPER